MSMADEVRKAHDTLAQNVLAKRHAKKLSREQAAERAQIAARHWVRIEAAQGSPSLTTMVKIAIALRVPVPDLLAPVQR